MAFDMENVNDLIDAAAELGPDMNEAQAGGGGNFELPAEGYVRLRLVSYIEIGAHNDTQQGQTKKKDFVILEFECSGPKHPVRESDSKPHLIRIKLSKSLNEKAHYFKLFKRLNHDGKAKHFAQLIGKAFLGTIVHNTTGEGDKARTYANLRDADGYTVRPAFKVDDESGESMPVKVDPVVSAIRVFIWDAPKGLKDMWDSIFIDGQYEVKEEGKETKSFSKNCFQDTIRKALNFKGSPISQIVASNGEEADVGDAEKPDRTDADGDQGGADADPLAGM